jgi:mRNA interferase MazF
MEGPYQKDFDRWHHFKEAIDKEEKAVDFHERELWWCSIGVNVGREQQSQTGDFSRPVLIVRRFTSEIFWGIPLTTKIKDEKFRYRISIGGQENDALLFHMRSYDRRRLVRKIGMLSEEDFQAIVELLISAL